MAITYHQLLLVAKSLKSNELFYHLIGCGTKVNLDPRVEHTMFLQVNFLTREAVIVKPEERFTEVDSFCLLQAPRYRFELFKPWAQIFF